MATATTVVAGPTGVVAMVAAMAVAVINKISAPGAMRCLRVFRFTTWQ